jgi:probable phosphoglycerate mutase
MDSRLVIQQMKGAWKIKHPDMQRLAHEAGQLLRGVKATFTWVPRAQNARADRLANEAMDSRGEVVRDYPDGQPIGLSGLDEAEAATEADPGGLAAALARAERASSASDGRPASPEPPGSPDSAPAADLAQVAARTHRLASGSYRAFSDAPATAVILVRHGVTDLTARPDDRMWSGAAVPGPDLTSEGHLQAQAAARLVARLVTLWPDVPAPTALYTSPTARTTQTARALGAELGLEPQAAPGFVEADFGQWDTLPDAEIERRWPGQVQRWYREADFAAPGGESLNQVAARIKAALRGIVEAHPGGTVVVASHAMAIRAALGVALGAPARAWVRFRLAPASVSAARYWADGNTEILGTNWTQLDVS